MLFWITFSMRICNSAIIYFVISSVYFRKLMFSCHIYWKNVDYIPFFLYFAIVSGELMQKKCDFLWTWTHVSCRSKKGDVYFSYWNIYWNRRVNFTMDLKSNRFYWIMVFTVIGCNLKNKNISSFWSQRNTSNVPFLTAVSQIILYQSKSKRKRIGIGHI